MAGFGEDLKNERERQGLSLEAMASETRFNLRHLQALEEGEYEKLPGGVFRRGILRGYLAAVGLDAGEWMPRFELSHQQRAQATGTAPLADNAAWAVFAENVKRNRISAQASNSMRWVGVLLLLLAVIAVAFTCWHFVLRARLGR